MANDNAQPLLNISKSILDTTYLELSQDWSLWENELDVAIQHITEKLCDTLQVARTNIWTLNAQANGLDLLDLYKQKSNQHSSDEHLFFKDYPAYFEALSRYRNIDAVDAHTDYRTRELSTTYLTPNGIGSMLDATLRKAGQLSGVLCIEHIGGPRLWNEHERRFSVSIADLISQRLIYEDIRRNEIYYRELSTLQQAIFDGANYGIISTEVDGTIRSFNNAASRMLGYSKEVLVGLHTPAMFHDIHEVQQRAKELSSELNESIEPGFEVFVAKARRGIAEEREWTYIRDNGTRFPVLLSVTALTDDKKNITGFLGISFDITDSVLTRRALREEEARYHILFENAGDCIFVMKGDLFIDCNQATLDIFGCTREQIIDQTPYRYSPEFQPDGRFSQEKALDKINAAFLGEKQTFDWLHLKYDGTAFDAEVTLNIIELHGEPHLLASVRDISERKIAQRELEQSRKDLLDRNEILTLINELSNRLHASQSVDTIINETFKALLGLTDMPQVAIYLLDENETTLRLAANYGFDEEILKIANIMPLNDSLTGLALQEEHLMVSSDFTSDNRLNEKIKIALNKVGINSGVVIPLIFQAQPLGSINLVYKNNRVFSDIELETFKAIGKTVSLSLANTRHMKELEVMAHHDSLTGLPNRSLLHKHFTTHIHKEAHSSAALLLLDLDRFKEINDTLGHYIGDKLLQKIGPRLSSQTTKYKTLFCRLGGDEFTVLIYGINDGVELLKYAESLYESLKQPYSIDSMILEIGVSIGVAVYPAEGKDSHELLRSADVAMYEAKHKGGGISRYNKETDVHTPERLALIAELGTAIREQQLCMHYQPKVDLKSKTITGFEALVRWQHPEIGLLYPDKFIHLAEVSDSIHFLTQAVLEAALLQQRQWREAGYRFTVSVNLSARNLIDDRLVDFVAALIKKYNTEPGMLELEITETALMQDPDRAASILNQISELGVRLSIDDFGTGFSSLSYLRRLPINALKIDREFVTDMLKSEQDSIIVRSTISLAHNLDLEVIAEGVEDDATLQALKSMGCDIAQGYFISKPKGWPVMETWLKHSPFKIK